MPAHQLAIALGANLGDPVATLIGVRPRLQALLADWGGADLAGSCRWSPLFRTAPVGGPAGQPDYLNAALVAGPLPHPAGDPLALLQALLALERAFGRRRGERWGPRLLDLDLLWCGAERLSGPELELPHPRLQQRRFVLAPLVAIDPGLEPPAEGPGERLPVAAWLERLAQQGDEPPPRRLPPRPGWPE